MTGNPITIDTNQIPEHVRLDLLSAIYNATAAYFQQPGVEEAFERWKAEREGRVTARAEELRKGECPKDKPAP